MRNHTIFLRSLSTLSVLWLAAPAFGTLPASSNRPPTTAKSPPPAAVQPATPLSTPRDFFNNGTQLLSQGKLREAEASFETTLASQTERFQTPALFNLGHVRFGQGVAELKKGPPAGPTAARGREAVQRADEASRLADDALLSEDVQRMVTAYVNGRGARRELKAAAKVVRQAMETYGVALAKWERSSGDFKGAAELDPAAADARQNAETVDRCIAKLVDSLHEMQQIAQAMAGKSQDLKDKMEQLKGRIPAPNMPPGAPGDEEEEEDMPKGPQEGQKEGATKEGEEMSVSPEQAGWLLEGFRLGSERRLPMGQNDTADPKASRRKPW